MKPRTLNLEEARKVATCEDVVEGLIESISSLDDQACMMEAMSRVLARSAVYGGSSRQGYMDVHGRTFDRMLREWHRADTEGTA